MSQSKRNSDHFKNSFYVLINSVVDRSVFFLFYIFLARAISKPDYGFIITIFAFTNILQAIFDLGLPFYIQREAASGINIKQKIDSIIYIKIISLILFLSIPVLYFYPLINSTNIILIIIISFINFGLGISNIFNSIFLL
ncbi:MAG TPA: hypothetical protein ENI57_01165 [Ignavibacteria bacterium]|nr:hypothetical protein [Ignavibacteria bacterium]